MPIIDQLSKIKKILTSMDKISTGNFADMQLIPKYGKVDDLITGNSYRFLCQIRTRSLILG